MFKREKKVKFNNTYGREYVWKTYETRKRLPGGGGNLTCLWYGVVPFFRVPFHDSFRIYGYGFQQFVASSGFMGIVFYQNSVIGELFWHSRVYGYDFQKFYRFMGILLRNFSGFMGGTFTI